MARYPAPAGWAYRTTEPRAATYTGKPRGGAQGGAWWWIHVLGSAEAILNMASAEIRADDRNRSAGCQPSFDFVDGYGEVDTFYGRASGSFVDAGEYDAHDPSGGQIDQWTATIAGVDGGGGLEFL